MFPPRSFFAKMFCADERSWPSPGRTAKQQQPPCWRTFWTAPECRRVFWREEFCPPSALRRAWGAANALPLRETNTTRRSSTSARSLCITVPQGASLNNLEFDHADIYANVDEIIRQFHYLLRTIPPDGKVVARAGDANLKRALQTGVYSPVDFFGGESDNENEDNNDNNPPNIRWRWRMNGDAMEVWDDGRLRASFIPPLPGAMNRDNILAAIALADWAGASADDAKNHLRDFAAPLRRLQFLGERHGVKVYDDFAHHPTAYAATIRALREAEPKSRLLAVFEPRSNTMKTGVFRAALAESLSDADIIIACKSAAKWNLRDSLRDLGARATVVDNAGEALSQILAVAQKGDCILTMSNGPFDGLAKKVLQGLAKN